MLGDEIQMMFDNGAAAMGHIRGGRVRGLGIAAKVRATALPDVPTFDEAGIANFYSGVPHGVLVSAGTPFHIGLAVFAVMASLIGLMRLIEYTGAVSI